MFPFEVELMLRHGVDAMGMLLREPVSEAHAKKCAWSAYLSSEAACLLSVCLFLYCVWI